MTASPCARSRASRRSTSIQLGTVSKTLAPGAQARVDRRAAATLADEAERAKRLLDDFSPALDQLTLAEFLRRGDYDRHVRRARAVYRARRDRLLARSPRSFPSWRCTASPRACTSSSACRRASSDAAISDEARARVSACRRSRRSGSLRPTKAASSSATDACTKSAVEPATRALAGVVRRHLRALGSKGVQPRGRTDSAGRAVVIASAWRCTIFHASPSRRRMPGRHARVGGGELDWRQCPPSSWIASAGSSRSAFTT